MAIVGFNFTKIDVERKETPKGDIKIKNNIRIVDVKEYDIGLSAKSQKSVSFSFAFESIYDPSVCNIKLSGNVLYMDSVENINKLLDGWKKNKTVPKEVMGTVLNTALARSSIQSVILSQEMNLPSPIPLPKVTANTGQVQSAAKAKK